MYKVIDFSLEETLECGQCFRFEKLEDNKYLVVANSKVIIIKQEGNELIFENIEDEKDEKVWKNYFDLDRDYKKIKDELSSTDKVLTDAINYKPGIRLLKQDVWECLISFIISQNKQIPHIKQVIKNISEAFGTNIGTYNDKVYYSFPTIEQLSKATEDQIRACKAGFRAPYIIDACAKINSGQIDIYNLESMETIKAKEELLKIKGVGNKISDCVALFSLSKHEVFPTDVWIKRVMEYFYMKEEAELKDIQKFAREQFGDYAGFAQQYLFYYARDKKIGKK